MDKKVYFYKPEKNSKNSDKISKKPLGTLEKSREILA